MTSEERVASLYARMATLRGRRKRRRTTALGVSCAGLCICLFLLIFNGGAIHGRSTPGQYSGTAMLFEDAGGYVLVAVIAFTVGAVVTAAIQKRRSEKPDLKTDGVKRREEEEK